MANVLLRATLALSLGVAILAVTMPASAQPNDSNISLDAPGLLLKKPKRGLPDVKAQPLAWPRLDPGAVLCRTDADLERLGARRRGETVEGSIDCQIIRAATAISIVQRRGPGMTEVAGSDPKGGLTGWTDAWLPDKNRSAPHRFPDKAPLFTVVASVSKPPPTGSTLRAASGQIHR